MVSSHFIRVLFGLFGRLEVVREGGMFWFSCKNYIKSQIVGKDLFISALIVTVLFGHLEDIFLGSLFLHTTVLKCVNKTGHCLAVRVAIHTPRIDFILMNLEGLMSSPVILFYF